MQGRLCCDNSWISWIITASWVMALRPKPEGNSRLTALMPKVRHRILFCRAMQYLLTCKASRYCLLASHGRITVWLFSFISEAGWRNCQLQMCLYSIVSLDDLRRWSNIVFNILCLLEWLKAVWLFFTFLLVDPCCSILMLHYKLDLFTSTQPWQHLINDLQYLCGLYNSVFTLVLQTNIIKYTPQIQISAFKIR